MIKRDCWDEYSKEEIEKWNTRELMAHFGDVRAYRHNCLRIVDEREDQLKEAILTLSLHEKYMDRLKEILSTREHIPNKQEAKIIRQENAKAKQNR
jgi:hypothetical protein